VKIGDYNELSVARESCIGVFLCDEDGLEVLLPKRYVDETVKLGGWLKAFIYKDSEDRVIATTEEPLATVNSFAMLTVKEVTPIGVFLDWGLPKDLLIPKKEISSPPEVGDAVLVYVYLDRLTQRLAASMRLERYVSDRPENLNFGDEVEIIVWKRHDLGYQAIIDEEYLGMIYDNQRFQTIQKGDRMKAYVNQIRTDGRIDLLLQAPGYKVVDDHETIVLNALAEAGGFLPYHDKSDPDKIQKAFGMSKKVFKKVLGSLYKQGKVKLETGGTLLKQAGRRPKR
jgi:hypothetical protein